MKVKEFLKMMGDCMYCTFDIIWNFEKGGADTERSIRTQDIEAVLELFGNCEIAKEDSIYLTPIGDEEVTVALYVHKPDIKNISVEDSLEEEKEILCPQCGAEHDIEDDTEEGEHCCFYCGHSWKDAEEDTIKE